VGEQDEVLLERGEDEREVLARELRSKADLVEVVPTVEHADRAASQEEEPESACAREEARARETVERKSDAPLELVDDGLVLVAADLADPPALEH